MIKTKSSSRESPTKCSVSRGAEWPQGSPGQPDPESAQHCWLSRSLSALVESWKERDTEGLVWERDFREPQEVGNGKEGVPCAYCGITTTDTPCHSNSREKGAHSMKVRFSLEDGGIEMMHVREHADGVFTLENTPFYVYGLSFDDAISIEWTLEGPEFKAVLARRGHSTYRVRFQAGASDEEFLLRWQQLAALGCTYESSNIGESFLYAVDVPPCSPIEAVYQILESGEVEGVWQFEEGHYCAPEGGVQGGRADYEGDR